MHRSNITPDVTCRELKTGRRVLILLIAIGGIIVRGAPAAGQERVERPLTAETLLTPDQWRSLDQAVDQGLEFLARQQGADGSFESIAYAQPAITSLCVMAFLSRGHCPGEGPYGEQINRGIEYVLATQQTSGLLCALPTGSNVWEMKGSYNHAISGVMLGEVYGMTGGAQQQPVQSAIRRALEFSIRQQQGRKSLDFYRGGWRYLELPAAPDADLSVTSWQLMFYRSARNAEFEIPEQSLAAAVDYVKRCYRPREGTFGYYLPKVDGNTYSRAMAGAGILSLSLAGQHDSELARGAGRFLLDHPFDRFNEGATVQRARFFYDAYYASLGMFQLGGAYWAEFFPVLLKTLVDNQRSDGAWDGAHKETELGLTYSTSLAILALTPPYQLLPIYQR